jgi:hypothetical protein
MQKTKSILAAALLSIAFTGYSLAQTPSPTPTASPTPNPYAGTYQDSTLSIPQRLQLANTVLSSGTPASVFGAAQYMLSARPVINLLNAFPQFDAQVLTDPTLSGTLNDPNQISALYYAAVSYKTASIVGLSNQVAYLQPLLSSTLFTPSVARAAQQAYAGLVYNQANLQYQAGNYSGVITTLAPVLGWNGNSAVVLTASSKIMLRSPDMLSWAKLACWTFPYQQKQAGYNLETSALRSRDTDIVSMNQLIAYATSGTGTNPMAGVTVPQVTFLGNSPQAQALNFATAGDTTSALKVAMQVFSTADIGAPLNAATGFVSQWLSNIDGNNVRSNAFAAAQANNQPFNIVELSGTGGN